MDDNQIIRVRTRLSGHLLSYNVICPILLPRASKFTEVVIRHFHVVCLHAGLGITLQGIREEYWISRGRQRVQSVISNCVRCKRFRAFRMLIQNLRHSQNNAVLARRLNALEWTTWDRCRHLTLVRAMFFSFPVLLQELYIWSWCRPWSLTSF